jgi:hypothetical protein
VDAPTSDDVSREAPPGGVFAGHADQYRPLGSYALLTVLFNGSLAAALVAAARAGRLPERYGLGDLALIGAGTFKLSRLVARDRVTSAIRAPFTRFQGDAGHGEVDEAARGTGMRRAIGELLVCDYCLAQWFAAAGVVGLAAAPRTTRALGAVFTSYAISDFLQVAYVAAQEHA